jgi:hypothetical protein
MNPSEIAVKVRELLLPRAPIRFEPAVDALERLGDESARAPLGVASACDETGTLKDFEVLRDGWLAQFERLHEF